MQDIISDALRALKSSNGSTRDELVKYILANHPEHDGQRSFVAKFRAALTSGIKAEKFEEDGDRIKLFVSKPKKKSSKKPKKIKREVFSLEGVPDRPVSAEESTRLQEKLMQVLQDVHKAKPSERRKFRLEALYEHKDNETWHPVCIVDIRPAGGSDESETEEYEYRIHYLGWNKRYDEWVKMDLMRVAE